MKNWMKIPNYGVMWGGLPTFNINNSKEALKMPNTLDLTSRYLNYVDERFTEESRHNLVTNNNFSWDGAHSVKVYSVSTSPMYDYGRSGPDGGNWSRYGEITGLDATTQVMPLSQDRSFTFAVDRLDVDETQQALAAQAALARQLREVVVPEVEAFIFGKMCANAGTITTPEALTPDNIYERIIDAVNVLDNASVPERQRVLCITPDTLLLLKKCPDFEMTTTIDEALKVRGVIGTMSGMGIMRIPAAWLPEDFGFMITHSIATVAPVKLQAFHVHNDPPGISGSLIEGRISYDAFVLDNKKQAIYLQRKVV
jgi:hypothetical protein